MQTTLPKPWRRERQALQPREERFSPRPLAFCQHSATSVGCRRSRLDVKGKPIMIPARYLSDSWGVGGTVVSESAMRSARTFLTRVRAPEALKSEINLLWTDYV
ncbi:hypothetical protein PoB_001276400 [Plakobranchus ocellatus]|uniref:Uncharacterized protein n=1 Tax=Plakobranchus ocellatus TaxID=259542 RepID=A0AAV3YX08_9GAST|nr:hypothetical protein PoB_001276400 [Plakobranchus ocellatus]